MRNLGNSKIALVSILAVVFCTFGFQPAQGAKSLVQFLPPAERNVFILDISGSTNSVELWKNSLRPSLIKKLKEPFGFPANKGLKKSTAPMDVSVSVINAQSIDAPIFPIVSINDAETLWGLIDKIGENPTSRRLSLIVEDIFGGQGARIEEERD